MSRVLLVILLFANLLLYAYGSGQLGPSGPVGEPQRLLAQVKADRIRLVTEDEPPEVPVPVQVTDASPPVAPADPVASSGGAEAATAAGACLQLQGLDDDETALVRKRVTELGSGWKLDVSRQESVSSWWVHLPSSGGRDGAERRVAEVRRLGVTDYFVVQDAGPNQHAVSLGLYKNETAAQRLADQLRNKGVKGVVVQARMVQTNQVEIRGPEARLPDTVAMLAERFKNASRHACLEP